MSVPDVLGEVSDRLVQGLMFHNEQASLNRLLGFYGFAAMHEYQYLSDSICMRLVNDWCVDHCGMIPQQGRQSASSVLDKWRGRDRDGIDRDMRRRALIESFEEYVAWERGTLSLYQRACDSFVRGGESFAYHLIETLVCEVGDELAEARRMWTELSATDWDMAYVMEQQRQLESDYRKLTAKIGKELQ